MKKEKIKKITPYIPLCFFILLFIFSITKITMWKLDSNKTKDQIKDIKDKVEIIEKIDTDKTEIIEQEQVIDEKNPYWDYIKMNLIDVNFSELMQTNNETIGWIQINGTNINYPFVQTNNNDFYLNHSFDKSYNQAGWVFLDYRNKLDGTDKNTILYAHGRYDNTMFGTLKNVFTNGWLNNTNNYVIKLSTAYENTLWQVFSVYHIPTTSDYIQTKFNNDNEYLNFINMLLNRSTHNFNTSVSENDKIITLSTCLNKQEKVVLHAKLIKRESR